MYWYFSGGPLIQNPPCSAGDAGSIPGQGTKLPHAAEQLSPHTATTEPTHLSQRTLNCNKDPVQSKIFF